MKKLDITRECDHSTFQKELETLLPVSKNISPFELIIYRYTERASGIDCIPFDQPSARS